MGPESFLKVRHYKTEAGKTTKVCGGDKCEPLNHPCCQLDGRDACYSDRVELSDVRKDNKLFLNRNQARGSHPGCSIRDGRDDNKIGHRAFIQYSFF